MVAFNKMIVTLASIGFLAVATSQDPCMSAFQECRFQIAGEGLQTFDVTGPAGQAFTPEIITRMGPNILGVANTNLEGDFILDNGDVILFSKKAPSPAQPFAPFVFKAFNPSQGGQFSGIGHEYFQPGQPESAKGMCSVQSRCSSELSSRE